ncbi:hypothetical protein LLG95_13590 [bacterium]|nr:hypothetical protein [bacterium]
MTLLFCLVCFFHASFAAERRDLAALLPEETIAIVRAPDMPSLIRAFEGSRLDDMYHDQDDAKVFRSLRREITSAQDRMAARGSISNRQLRAFARGEAILAAIPPSGGGKSVQWVLLFEHSGDPAVLKALNEGPKPSNARVEKSQQRIGPFPMTHFRIVREVAAKIPGAKGGSDALRQVSEEYDQYLGPSIGVYGPAAGNPVPRILDRLARAQAGEAFAPPSLLTATDSLKTRGQAVLAVDLGRIVHQSILNMTRGKQSLLFDPRAFEISGVRAAASVDLKPDRIGVELAIETPAQPGGAAQLLTLAAPLPRNASDLVPADAFAYTALGYPLDGGWQKLRAVFAAASPSLNQSLQMQLQSIHQATGTDVEAGLFHNLDNSVIRFVWPKNGGKSQLEMSTFLVRVKNEKAFQASLDLLLKYISQGFGLYQIVHAQYLGQPLWGLRPGRPDVASQVEPSFWFGLAGGWAVCGMRIEGVREAIRRIGQNPADSLGRRSRFKSATAALPPDRVGEGYIDLGAMARITSIPAPVRDAAKRMKITPLMPGESGAFGKLWSQYFAPIAVSRTVENNTMRIQAIALAKGK